MTTSFTNVFSIQDIDYLNQHPEVLKAKAKLTNVSSGSSYFNVPINPSIRAALVTRFGIDLAGSNTVPMRWIKGDTAPHVDVGSSSFDKTHLVYITDSDGAFVVGSEVYPITQNTGFVFAEGTSHKTLGTGGEPRLLVGPMSERAFPVGSTLTYYPTEADALAYTNVLGYGISFVVGSGGPFGGFTSWRLASNSNGTSSQAVVYQNGDTLNSDGNYYLYPAAPCFLEGSKILCLVGGVEKEVPVEKLTPGTLVKTALNGYKKVELVGKGSIKGDTSEERTENRLYKCSPSKYPGLKEDLYITGCHSILVSALTEEQREKTIIKLGATFVTDNKYRLMACVDERAEPVFSHTTYPIYHFALENKDPKMNYGVYASGLLVETCSLNFLKNKSNMTIL
jgi:hypothetical protein